MPGKLAASADAGGCADVRVNPHGLTTELREQRRPADAMIITRRRSGAARADRLGQERAAGGEARAREAALRARLDGALRDQRRLAAQLGRVQAGSGRLALRGALAAAPAPSPSR